MTKREIYAIRAERTLIYYASLLVNDPNASLIDLLTDFRHYCNDDGLDFDYFSMESKKKFKAEDPERLYGGV
ncbi:conserved protein of unknown function [Georgfuchsia toluolica]|uniref:Uncharacterized protein n=1 Tax=Georgfuchsia toluolica TaxID=424218 RepID=A0A916J2V3_9PROT|nr:hypothetical protein [Georgfuchsia toluolica]CAG4882961.1 conserved protein of unknown function [Georgfuchsia toluolica]